VAEVATASQEQTGGIGQLNQAVGQMDKVTQSNAAGAEESASAAEELNAQAVSLQEAAGELLTWSIPRRRRQQRAAQPGRGRNQPAGIIVRRRRGTGCIGSNSATLIRPVLATAGNETSAATAENFTDF